MDNITTITTQRGDCFSVTVSDHGNFIDTGERDAAGRILARRVHLRDNAVTVERKAQPASARYQAPSTLTPEQQSEARGILERGGA